ncbi:MAG: hypothetical protein V4693_18755 [Pseudomonadota bacterium]
MKEIESAFLQKQVRPLERFLLGLPLGRLFTGILYTIHNHLLEKLDLEDFGNGRLSLSSAEVGRMFMAPDESVVSVLRLSEQDDFTPAGFNVKSDNEFVQEGKPVVVVAYQDIDGPGLRLDSLHLARVMLIPDAPARFCTAAFGLMACTANRHGFKKITLFAGGNGPPPEQEEEGDLVGYMVWPKFGFDAELIPADLNLEPRLSHCRSVLEVTRFDSCWWEQHGRGREMWFDLAPSSRSWKVLLNYIYVALAGSAQ